MNATPTPVTYTVWNPPGALFPIRYSLALFREIEFFVGEGYRRIPHGGLEVGAVLYGHGEPAEVTIQAFRPIESQHSFGPSFTLSLSDLEQLGRQAAKPLITDAGDELEVVGWVISNCRSELVLTDQETRIYDEYFPGPRQVTLLAKPEKFKPTRYAFLARPRRGGLLERACRDSFILPLSAKGDATAARETPEETPASPAFVPPAVAADPEISAREVQPLTPAPPLPEPALESAPDRPAPVSPPVVLALEEPTLPEAEPTPASASALSEDAQSGQDDSEPDFDLRPIVTGSPLPTPPPDAVEPEMEEPLAPQLVTEQSVPPAPTPDVPSEPVPDLTPAPTPDVKVEPVSTKAEEGSPALLPVSAPPDEAPSPPANATAVPTHAASVPANVPVETTENVTRSVPERPAERSPERLYRAGRSVLMLQPEAPPTETLPEGPIQRLRARRQSRESSSWLQILLGVAIVAALAAAAIWTYLRLPAPPIPLNAEVQPGQVVVTWAPELTKSADRCSITTWINGQSSSQALSADEQSEGRAIIQTTSSDVTIQLRAPQWYQERNGQIRVFRIIPPPPPAALPSPAKRVFAFPQGGSEVPPIVGRPADPVPQRPPQ